MTDLPQAFDFRAHQQAAIAAYLPRQVFYQDLSTAVRRIVEESLKIREIRIHSIEARAKAPASLGRKATTPSEVGPAQPKYPKPLEDITDLAAVRVIAFFPKTLAEIDQMIREEFIVVERTDKREDLVEEERFGYATIHYLVRVGMPRANLPEYERFREAVTEIQVRTILQHAWAEIEHDIQYKSASAIPTDIRRRFMALAGMLEIADREFQAIQDADRALTETARGRVEAGQLEEVEIAPNALKLYLDRKLGPDGRISEYSYEWTVRLLKKLGFKTLAQVNRCIAAYDDDRLSRVVSGSRQGQTTRFEYMLLAGMGDRFIQRHIFAGEPWYGTADRGHLKKIQDAQIAVGSYDPLVDQVAP